MIRRLVYVVTLVLWCATNAVAADKPNILFILTDDQGWWDVGIRGNSFIDTPVLDRFARDIGHATRREEHEGPDAKHHWQRHAHDDSRRPVEPHQLSANL